MRGNIRVHCRVRPLIAALDSAGPSKLGTFGKVEQVVRVVDDETVCVQPNKSMSGGSTSQKKMFEFERVYEKDSTQEFVFQDVLPLLTSLLDG